MHHFSDKSKLNLYKKKTTFNIRFHRHGMKYLLRNETSYCSLDCNFFLFKKPHEKILSKNFQNVQK